MEIEKSKIANAGEGYKVIYAKGNGKRKEKKHKFATAHFIMYMYTIFKHSFLPLACYCKIILLFVR